jgi:EpsD family peptidyl-prolyl cis-trans isomerase
VQAGRFAAPARKSGSPHFTLAHGIACAALLVTLAATLVSGFGDKKVGGKSVATQVAAKVNKREITVRQINGVLQRAGAISAEEIKRAGGEVLERLIDEELLVQQAQEKKLDRSAAVVQAVEAAKREIYARAYLEQIAAQATKPDAAAVAAFYNENPVLFAKRRIYSLQELSLQIADDRLPALRQEISDARNLAEIANWLRAEKIPFSASTGVKAAEQLPLESVPRFAAAKDGQIVLSQAPGGLVISYIVESRELPLDEKGAAPAIEQSITNRKKIALVQAELKRLRETGTIEYLGEFARTAGATAAAETRPKAPAAAVAPPAAPATADQRALVKGSAGLR